MAYVPNAQQDKNAAILMHDYGINPVSGLKYESNYLGDGYYGNPYTDSQTHSTLWIKFQAEELEEN